jgi:hypothetical protein
MPTFAVFSSAAIDDEIIAPDMALVPLASRSEYPPRSRDRQFRASVSEASSLSIASPLRFPYPSTTSDVGSDLRWVYLTQLRYAFRLSQPLDVSFRPHPSSLVSCWYRPWAFDLQRFSPRASRQHLSMQAAPRVLSSRHRGVLFRSTRRHSNRRHLGPNNRLNAPKRSSPTVR